ncbi:MAG TPA: DUF2934 domain-containing protein [Terriglobales bacterium]|nr:DUF2934 domain-containing protein [Terriglobales bacterium]HVN19693.1 DUF2934 domain-containing protein [Dongiaceae bacterium]
MPRKTDGISTPRKKKSVTPAESAAVTPAVQPATDEVQSSDVRSEIRGNVTPINVAPVKSTAKKPQATNLEPANLDEEIRRRAYELFQQRNGTPGDPNADWLVAEREVRARYAGKDSALAASQGRG